jgi:hypothetical protein
MRRFGWRTDGHHGLHLIDVASRGKNRSSAEAVPDDQVRRGQCVTHMICRSNQIFDIGGEVGVGEFPSE